MKAYDNRNLIVPDKDDFPFKGKLYRKIILNAELDAVLVKIDKYWTPNSEVVTSGIRTPDDSLRIIRQYLKSKGLHTTYHNAMNCVVDEKIGDLYVWQPAWSHLLSLNVIINPPLSAKCLMDYHRNGINKKGMVIGQSPHVRKKAFDLSGLDSLPIVKKLVEDKIIRGYLLERENNCIHCDI